LFHLVLNKGMRLHKRQQTKSSDKYYIRKGKRIDKSKHEKTNTINNSSKVKEARSEKHGKINMNFLTVSYTQRKTRKSSEKINCNQGHNSRDLAVPKEHK